jgi:hypothetical protein
MNLRTLKKLRSTQQHHIITSAAWLKRLDSMFGFVPAKPVDLLELFPELNPLVRGLALNELIEDLPDLAPEYRCVKVNGGDIVDTFQTRSEALALVLKHARQRKAKLQVLNSDTGEVEVFTEAELA